MALQTDVSITNKDNSKIALFRGARNWKFKKFQPAIPIPIVNTTPANNVLFRFQGQTEQATFTFVLTDDGTDISSGTGTSTAVTVDEQIAYLRNEFYTENFDVDWTLVQNRYFPSPGIDGVIVDLSIESEAGGPNQAIGQLTFIRGRIGAL